MTDEGIIEINGVKKRVKMPYSLQSYLREKSNDSSNFKYKIETKTKDSLIPLIPIGFGLAVGTGVAVWYAVTKEQKDEIERKFL